MPRSGVPCWEACGACMAHCMHGALHAWRTDVARWEARRGPQVRPCKGISRLYADFYFIAAVLRRCMLTAVLVCVAVPICCAHRCRACAASELRKNKRRKPPRMRRNARAPERRRRFTGLLVHHSTLRPSLWTLLLKHALHTWLELCWEERTPLLLRPQGVPLLTVLTNILEHA
jgi:hypothetical protein